jgi:UDP-2,3-diacylglucosamine hydrolase
MSKFDLHELDAFQVRRGVFVSDLHLFSPRSAAAGLDDQIAAYREAHECIILGGDIFDFKWSTHSHWRATLAAADQWLRDLLDKSGESQIVYLAGNHDCHPEFLEQLDRLAKKAERLSWHPHAAQLGDCLFLHGDVLDAGASLQQLGAYRERYQHTSAQPDFLHRSYDAAVAMRIHKWLPKLHHRQEKTVDKLGRLLLELLPDDSLRTTDRVYFGHTHNPIRGRRKADRIFYNPGSALKHMAFVPLEFGLPEGTKGS